MKKTLSLLLALVICLSLCACGRGTQSETNATTEPVITQEPVITRDVYYKNEGPLGEYIRNNGMNSITITPGKGYYADRKDYSYRHDVGIEGTPLYDAVSVDYMGDFMIKDEWGVHLNKYYKETEYRNKTIYFRGYPINLDWYNTAGTGAVAPQFPETDILEEFINNDNLVWSGDYLLLFSDDGVLIDWCELK